MAFLRELKDVDESEIVKISDLAGQSNNGSIEELLVAIHKENLRRIKNDSISEYKELKQRQSEVTFLHKLISTINAAANDKGEIDLKANPELETMMKKAEELGVKLPDFKKNKVTREQRDQLVASIRSVVEDENLVIDMHMQKISNLNYEMNESYQWMRSHSKTLHDIKQKIASKLDARH